VPLNRYAPIGVAPQKKGDKQEIFLISFKRICLFQPINRKHNEIIQVINFFIELPDTIYTYQYYQAYFVQYVKRNLQ